MVLFQRWASNQILPRDTYVGGRSASLETVVSGIATQSMSGVPDGLAVGQSGQALLGLVYLFIRLPIHSLLIIYISNSLGDSLVIFSAKPLCLLQHKASARRMFCGHVPRWAPS